jgi:beta-mannosidase
VDNERYLELSRAVSGEVMSATFGEWRRAASPCEGGLVLWLRDLVPGAGWGLLDHGGEPKEALHHVRRALAPVAVWMAGEGLNGVDVHAANDGERSLAASLRIALFRNFEQLTDEAELPLELEPHSVRRVGLEDAVGRFVDAAWAYRFGPPAQDLIVASLEAEDGLLSQAFFFPAGPPSSREPAAALGLEAEAAPIGGGALELTLRSRRLAHGVRVKLEGYKPSDDAFSVAPGGERRLSLTPRDPGTAGGGNVTLTALNLEGRFRVPIQEAE